MHPQRRWILIRCIALAVCLSLALAWAWSGFTQGEQGRLVGTEQEDELMRKAEALVRTVHGLEAMRHAPAAPSLDALFAVQPHVAQAPKQPAPRPVMRHSVDMVIAAGEQGRAIVSGRLTRIGDILPDASRVMDIRADSVVVQLKGQIHRLPAPQGRISAQENGP